jgi:hypothetical protein
MAENPLRKSDRIFQTQFQPGDIKQSVSLYDVDYAIMSYLEDVVLPTLNENGKAIKIPVVYGNSERWVGARKDGVYRDAKGKIQLPMLMIRRTNVAKNESMPMLNRHVSYQSIKKYSKENRYDRFSLMTGAKPKYEIYNITMPDYVEIKYESMAWTSYTEHLNTIIESLNWASDEYWGDKKKFKFVTTIDDYNVINELSEGAQRINRVEFNLTVKAYLLPEKFDGERTTTKGFSSNKLILTTETDFTGNGRMEGFTSTTSPYYNASDISDYIALNNSLSGRPTINNTITFSNIDLITIPPTLSGVVPGTLVYDTKNYDLKVYINGTKYNQTTHFNAIYSTNTLIINFLSANLGFNVTSADEITITGKFITL